MDLAYDGTGFAGWALQPGRRTVQGVLEDGLATVLRAVPLGRPAPRVTVAGRTDAGVHARGQVAHVDVETVLLDAARGRSDRPVAEALLARLAGVLPPDLVVHRAAVAPHGFDARFSALRRRYAYRVCDDHEHRDPLTRAHVLWHRRSLDADAMDTAARALLGRHDFAAFCKPRQGATTIRTLEVFRWRRAADGPDAGLVVAEVQADAFCHSMVRALVGASLAVGEGRRPTGWPADLLVGRRRDGGATVVPARGLTLEAVGYPSDEELSARAEQTRARREADDVDAPPGCCG
ncbi:tRNA pseudouridine(38-40) synthase TruA [Cellulomonas sp. URHB0016]